MIPEEAKLTYAEINSLWVGGRAGTERLRQVADAQLSKAAPIIAKQERERILAEAEEDCPHYYSFGSARPARVCDICWAALKGERPQKGTEG